MRNRLAELGVKKQTSSNMSQRRVEVMKSWLRLALVLASAYPASSAGADAGEEQGVGEIHVSVIHGRASVLVQGQSATALTTGMRLRHPATIETGAGAKVTLTSPNGDVFVLSAQTQLTVEKFLFEKLPPPLTPPGSSKKPPARAEVNHASVTKLRFEKGEIELTVNPMNFSRGSSFVVVTPAGAVGVRGTHFRMRLQPVGDGVSTQFSLEVLEGVVALSPKAGPTETVVPGVTYRTTVSAGD